MSTTVHLPRGLLASVDRQARALDMSRNRYIIRALERAVATETGWSPEFIEELGAARADAGIEVDNAILRARYLDGHKTYTSREVRELSGLATRNPSEPASRWKRHRRIFGVPVGNQDRYPAFQFAEGRPRPEIARIMAVLPNDMSPWQVAFWFASSNRWVEDDKPPQEALDEIDRVLAAATDLASDEIG